MDDVLEIAEKLASAIRASSRFVRLRAAEKAIDADPEAGKILADYNEITLSIIRKEQEMRPVEPEEKRKLAALKEKVVANKLLQELSGAQADFSEMMNKVNRSLHSKLGSQSAPPK